MGFIAAANRDDFDFGRVEFGGGAKHGLGFTKALAPFGFLGDGEEHVRHAKVIAGVKEILPRRALMARRHGTDKERRTDARAEQARSDFNFFKIKFREGFVIELDGIKPRSAGRLSLGIESEADVIFFSLLKESGFGVQTADSRRVPGGNTRS